MASPSSTEELIRSALSDSLCLLTTMSFGRRDRSRLHVRCPFCLRIEENEELRGRDFAWRTRANIDFLSPLMREEATAFFEADRTREANRLHIVS